MWGVDHVYNKLIIEFLLSIKLLLTFKKSSNYLLRYDHSKSSHIIGSHWKEKLKQQK